MPEPLDLHGATFNSGGTNTNIDNLANYINNHDLHYLLLPNPPAISQLHALQLQQHHHLGLVYTTPPTTNKTAQVAIIYNLEFFNPHNPPDLLEDPSGRLLSIILSPILSNTKVQLIASYFPPNLDATPILTPQQLNHLSLDTNNRSNPIEYRQKNSILKRREAERLRFTITTWAQTHKADLTILGGDQNETLNFTDRLPQNKASTHRTNTLFNLTNDGWRDAFEIIPESLSTNTDDPEELGHTYYHHNSCSSSRLDHFFIWRPDLQLTHQCYVNNSFDLNPSTSQHRPLHLSATLPTANATTNQKPKWKPKTLYIPPNLTAETALQISATVNTALLQEQPQLQDDLESLSPDDPNAENKLDKLTQTLSTALFNLYKVATTTKQRSNHHGTQPKHNFLPQLQQALVARKHFLTLQFWTQRILKMKTTTPSRNFYTKKNAAALIYLNNSPIFSYLTADIASASWQLSNQAQWQAWLHRSSSLLRRLNLTIAEHTPTNHLSYKKYKHKMFSTSKGRSKFYEYAFHKKNTNDTLKGVWTTNGQYLTDPTSVTNEIQKQMAQQFSNNSTGPAVNAARPLDRRELESGIPHWWHTGNLSYARGAGYAHAEHLLPLQQPTTPLELKSLIATKTKRETSPGLDGISTGVIKILTNTYFNQDTTQNEEYTPTLKLLVAYTNASLRLGKIAHSQKRGLICMHPKPGKDPKLLSNRRPITLLPELGKLPFRLIAHRLTDILHHHPNILDPAQRAYITDGSTKQCLELLMEITKHFNKQNNANRANKTTEELQQENLIILCYDIKKAFDSVQKYSIEATLNRFNFPIKTISLILSALDNATSCVKTHHGPTAPIKLLTSVKQGDPLAALLFIFLIDNLHKGLRNNPLYPTHTAGYNCNTPQLPHNIPSIGYADDTTIINTSWEDTKRQHMWVLDFLIAHRLQLNADKTTCIAANALPPNSALPTTSSDIVHDPLNNKPVINAPFPPLSSPLLPPTPIALKPPSHTTRVLGLQYNVQENCTPMKRNIDAILFSTCKRIKEANLNISHTAFVLSEYLYPKLELGLTFYTYSSQDLKLWDTTIQQTIFHHKNGPHITRLPLAARWATLGLNPLSAHYKYLQSAQYLTSLQSTHSPASQLRSKQLSVTIAQNEFTFETKQLGFSNYNFHLLKPTRHQPHHNHLNRQKIFLAFKPAGPATRPIPLPPLTSPPDKLLPLSPPQHHIHLQHSTSTLQLENTNCNTHMTAFTDGSCLKHLQNQCGYATILLPTATLTQPDYNFAHNTFAILDGGSPYSGLNYTAEAMAILRALLAVPLTTSLTIYTDCKSLADHLKALPTLSESQQLKLGARTVLLNIRNILRHRNQLTTTTKFIHIYSHTNDESIYTKGNDLADTHAKRAAHNPNLEIQRETPFLATSFPFFFVQERKTTDGDIWYTHHNGNLKKHLATTIHNNIYVQWANAERQGTVAKHDPHQLQLLIKALRNKHYNTLLLFLVLTACTMLPTPQRLLQYRSTFETHLQLCPLCHNDTATTWHALTCDRTRHQQSIHHQQLRTHLLSKCQQLQNLPIPPNAYYSFAECLSITSLPWYSLHYTPTQSQYFGHNTPNPQLRQQFHNVYQNHHPLSAALGIISPPLQQLLLPPPTSIQLPLHLHRAYTKAQCTQLMQIRIQTLITTFKCFTLWQQQAYLHYLDNPHIYPPFLKMKPGWLTFNYKD